MALYSGTEQHAASMMDTGEAALPRLLALQVSALVLRRPDATIFRQLCGTTDSVVDSIAIALNAPTACTPRGLGSDGSVVHVLYDRSGRLCLRRLHACLHTVYTTIGIRHRRLPCISSERTSNLTPRTGLCLP